jgi:hypothetical protein
VKAKRQLTANKSKMFLIFMDIFCGFFSSVLPEMSTTDPACKFSTVKLGNHSAVVSSHIKQLQWTEAFADLKIVVSFSFFKSLVVCC